MRNKADLLKNHRQRKMKDRKRKKIIISSNKSSLSVGNHKSLYSLSSDQGGSMKTFLGFSKSYAQNNNKLHCANKNITLDLNVPKSIPFNVNED